MSAARKGPNGNRMIRSNSKSINEIGICENHNLNGGALSLQIAEPPEALPQNLVDRAGIGWKRKVLRFGFMSNNLVDGEAHTTRYNR